MLHKLDEPSLADVRTLKTAAKKKTRAANIARSLKRTEGATRQKAFSLGLSLDSRGWCRLLTRRAACERRSAYDSS